VSWLTPGGGAAAILVGGAVWWGLGWRGLIPLFAFLLSGSVLTRLATGAGARRRARQVLANGGIAALAALLGHWPEAAGALAAAAADTWATEIGAFSKTPPRLITTGLVVSPGCSGGITLLGTAGGLSGAFTIAGLSGLVAPVLGWRGAVVAATGGAVGMLVDSLLGATVQARFVCPVCGVVSERAAGEGCHGRVSLARGIRWLDNDAVNLAGSLAGALLAGAGWLAWS